MEIVHYELGHGRVLCMLNEPLVTRNKTEVTCKRCLKKLKKSQPRARDITPHKMSVRHFVRGSDKKMRKAESMALTISDVKKLINEAVKGSGREKRLDFQSFPPIKFDPSRDSYEDVMSAAKRTFAGIGPDLGLDIEDPSDSAFLDYIGDVMSDHGVPEEIIARVLQQFKH